MKKLKELTDKIAAEHGLEWYQPLNKAEDSAGMTAIDLGNGYSLHHEHSENGHDIWAVGFNGERAGTFMLRTEDTRRGKPMVAWAGLEKPHRGKGIGTLAYKALAVHYGGLDSDKSSTSDEAVKAWIRAGGRQMKIKSQFGKPRYTLDGDKKRPVVQWNEELYKQLESLKKDNESYRIAHTAPTSDGGSPLHNLKDAYPDDIYSHEGVRYYGHGVPYDHKAISVIREAKDNPNAKVRIYRAVPKIKTNEEKIYELEQHKKHILKNGSLPNDAWSKPNGGKWKDTSEYYDYAHNRINELKTLPPEPTQKKLKINRGDWVATTREYAKEHGESVHGKGNYQILSAVVPAAHVWTDGNSIHEWGYDPIPLKKSFDLNTLIQQAKARLEGVKKVGSQEPRPMIFANKDGTKHGFVTVDPSKQGQWRVTHFVNNKPAGHTEAPTFSHAIKAAHDSGYNVFKEIREEEMFKAAPQAKFTKLLPANQRPEQDVKRIEPGISEDWEISGGHAKMTSPEKSTPSEKVSAKQLSYAYSKTGGKEIVRQIRKDPSVAIHDPYATGVSVASTKAPDEVVAHEAHHRTVTKLVVKYGLDKVHKLYDNMIQLIPNDVQRMLTSTLKNVPNYNAMHGSPDPRQRLAFKEEMVNLLRDFTTGKEGGRRRFLKDYTSAHYGSPEQFNKLDNVLKNTWQKVQDFANNATEDHMR